MRESNGWSQDELAKRMGYKTRNAIYQYEQCENMKLSLVEKFADVLGCSVSYLSGWDEEPNETTKDEEELQKAESDDALRKALLIVAYMKQLNEDGFEEAIKRIEELTQLDKYRKDDEG